MQHPSLKVKGKDIAYFTGMIGTVTPQKSHLVGSDFSLSSLMLQGWDHDHKTKEIMRAFSIKKHPVKHVIKWKTVSDCLLFLHRTGHCFNGFIKMRKDNLVIDLAQR